MTTVTVDVLDEAIDRATAKRKTLPVFSHAWDRLDGAIEVASYMRGYLNGVKESDPLVRQAVATALDLAVTG